MVIKGSLLLACVRFFLIFCTLLQVSLPAYSESRVSYDDPWEEVNRAVFEFNDTVDAWFLKPVAKGYDATVPKPIQGLVSSFFVNLGEVRNAVNALAQLKFRESAISIGRLTINTTFGMLGTVDVAQSIGLKCQYEDFGLTLAKWGVPSGPYVVLPFFGPRTIRSGSGIFPDAMLNLQLPVFPDERYWVAQTVDVVDWRASMFSTETLIVGDRYTFVRDAYLQRRDYLITGQLPEDDF